MTPPPLCLALLDPEQYVLPLQAIEDGKSGYTHLALIQHDGELRRWYVKAAREMKAYALDGDSSPVMGPMRELINEIIGHTLAHHAGLPQPRGGLIRLRLDQLRRIHPAAHFSDRRFFDDVICFASLEAHNPKRRNHGMAKLLYRDNINLRRALADWSALPAVMAFDSWVANIDRNSGNLIQAGRGQFALIDHGHILTGPHWQAKNLDGGKDFLNVLLDQIFDAAALPLPTKSAILKAAADFWPVYLKAEPELSFWLSGKEDPDKAHAQQFIRNRIDTVAPLLRSRVRLVT